MGVEWPLPPGAEPTMSAKVAVSPLFREADSYHERAHRGIRDLDLRLGSANGVIAAIIDINNNIDI
jgi:hypothetical protein